MRIKTVSDERTVIKAWMQGQQFPSHTAGNRVSHEDGVLKIGIQTLAILYHTDSGPAIIYASVITAGGWSRTRDWGREIKYLLDQAGNRIPYANVYRLYPAIDAHHIQSSDPILRESWIRSKAMGFLSHARTEYGYALAEKGAVRFKERMDEIGDLVEKVNSLLSLIGYQKIPTPPTILVHEHIYEQRTKELAENWQCRDVANRLMHNGKPMRIDKFGKLQHIDTHSHAYGPKESIGRAVNYNSYTYTEELRYEYRSSWRGETGWYEWLIDASKTPSVAK